LSAGHARALLAVSDPATAVELAATAAARGMSVREIEQLVRERSGGSNRQTPKSRTSTGLERSTPDSAVRTIEDDLRRYLQTDVRLRLTDQAKGTIELTFYSNEDLERLIGLILKTERW
jgi:ParB family transcriptional regulator, chromosome partitioning protein